MLHPSISAPIAAQHRADLERSAMEYRLVRSARAGKPNRHFWPGLIIRARVVRPVPSIRRGVGSGSIPSGSMAGDSHKVDKQFSQGKPGPGALSGPVPSFRAMKRAKATPRTDERANERLGVVQGSMSFGPRPAVAPQAPSSLIAPQSGSPSTTEGWDL
jgi:hypothetical protein